MILASLSPLGLDLTFFSAGKGRRRAPYDHQICYAGDGAKAMWDGDCPKEGNQVSLSQEAGRIQPPLHMVGSNGSFLQMEPFPFTDCDFLIFRFLKGIFGLQQEWRRESCIAGMEITLEFCSSSLLTLITSLGWQYKADPP